MALLNLRLWQAEKLCLREMSFDVQVVFMDGSAWKGYQAKETFSFRQIAKHHCVPLSVGCGRSLLIVGMDNRVPYHL